MRFHQPRRRARGMALLEVGVAMVVLSCAFLAVAMLLANTARNQRSGQALGRSAALAHEIAEQMRANRAAVEGLNAARGFVLDKPYAQLTSLDALPVPACGGRYERPPAPGWTHPPAPTPRTLRTMPWRCG